VSSAVLNRTVLLGNTFDAIPRNDPLAWRKPVPGRGLRQGCSYCLHPSVQPDATRSPEGFQGEAAAGVRATGWQGR
jgi:hypothetical protein